MKTWIPLLALLTATLALPTSASAYYDDVHYVLTYYVARQAGYTPEQAYRIASACVSVDYDPDTEPVQGPSQLALATTPFTGPAADPRWKFHAMRDEDALHAMGIQDVFADCIGDNGKSAQRAEDMVKTQEGKLWTAAGQIGNPGVFLHFYQDEVPHHGYGTWWGHWPMLPGSVQPYHDKGLTIGGRTDWIDFRPNDVIAVCGTSQSWLTQFMQANSPHQPPGTPNTGSYPGVVADLAKANRAPTDIDSEAKRASYIDFYAQSAVVSEQTAKPNDPFGIVAIAANQGVMISDIDFSKLKNGPDLVGACDVIDAALATAGMGDKIPREHFLYSLDGEGRMDNPSMADKFTLVGSMQVTTEGGEEVTATLLMLVTLGGKTSEVPLRDEPPVALKPNVPQTWDKLPIGDIIVELTHADGSKTRHKFTLDKRVNIEPPIHVADTGAEPQYNGIGGHWLYKKETTDDQGKKTTVLVPCYLTPQDDGSFNGVYFPFLAIDDLHPTPDQSPTNIQFKPAGGTTFTITWQYPFGGPTGTGTMQWSGSQLSGTWVEDGDGATGQWTWVRPDGEQLKMLQSYFGR